MDSEYSHRIQNHKVFSAYVLNSSLSVAQTHIEHPPRDTQCSRNGNTMLLKHVILHGTEENRKDSRTELAGQKMRQGFPEIFSL